MDHWKGYGESRSGMNDSRRSAGKRIRRSGQEGRRLADEWRKSGVSASEFCQRNAVPLHVLRYWAHQSNGGPTADRAGDFFVMTTEPQSGSNTAGNDEVGSTTVPKAVIIVVPLRSNGTALTETLRAVLGEVTW